MTAGQISFEDLGRPLSDVEFCVVDLETTGGSPAKGSKITEFGAVKVRGGRILGEFQTLVDPEGPIPAFITVLTGITDQMVVAAPTIDEVLPSFLEFARGAVLVAHNAPFDIGFLKHYARELGRDWPRFEVVDTARLAKRVLLRDEVPNCKLATLAAKFAATTVPNHRALSDARATVDVLHALFERLGSFNVKTLEDLADFNSRVTPEQRQKRHLADHVPAVPGVYLFRGPRDEVLYVGTSRNLRSRVRTYFTASETRSRMTEMVRLAERIEAVQCATPLEAAVRELRLIAAHSPPYNRRSRRQDKVTWVKLTREAWPRLSIVRHVADDGADYFGPFRGRQRAEGALLAFYDTFSIRQCTQKLPRRPRGTACVLAELKACLAPCDGRAAPEVYQVEVERLRDAITGDASAVVAGIEAKMADLAAQERYEDAAAWRDRLADTLRAVARTQRLTSITMQEHLVAARPGDKGWEVHVVRHGRLAAAGLLPPNVDAGSWVAQLVASAETVRPGHGPAPAASVAETELILNWLEGDDLRMVSGAWSAPLHNAARHTGRFDAAAEAFAATRLP